MDACHECTALLALQRLNKRGEEGTVRTPIRLPVPPAKKTTLTEPSATCDLTVAYNSPCK